MAAIALASVGWRRCSGPMFLRQAAFGAETERAEAQEDADLHLPARRGGWPEHRRAARRSRTCIGSARTSPCRARRADARRTSALDLDGFFGLHPALAPFVPIYKAGIWPPSTPAARPTATRSHFDAQDYMESGAPGNKRVADGWLARTVLACPEDRAKLTAAASGSPFRAVALGGDHGLPRSLQGDAGALAIPDLQTFGIGRPALAAGRRASA